MVTPKDLFRDFYYVLQAHTTQRPGPKFREILKKHGIPEVDPPSKEILNKHMLNIQKRSMPAANKIINGNVRPLVTVTSGGSWYHRVYHAMDAKNIYLFFAILLFISGGLIVHLNDDPQSRFFIEDGRRRAEETGAAILGTVGFGTILARRFARGYRYQTMVEQGIIRNDTFTDITTIPSSGELILKKSDKRTDPVTLMEFEDNDVVAVIAGNDKVPILVNSLIPWILQLESKGDDLIHPVTRELFTKDKIQIFTVKILENSKGGKRRSKHTRKTRKAKRKD